MCDVSMMSINKEIYFLLNKHFDCRLLLLRSCPKIKFRSSIFFITNESKKTTGGSIQT